MTFIIVQEGSLYYWIIWFKDGTHLMVNIIQVSLMTNKDARIKDLKVSIDLNWDNNNKQLIEKSTY